MIMLISIVIPVYNGARTIGPSWTA